ncbi:hypothetical protein [Methylobacterium sp. Leaf93]|uniref:hypothetical protein n=1 Tax=Methylobacterium sp. Leaf93 TaxID=1736249 RepID=UPI0006FAA0E6|nr:hypothetical protein [Methylobacterium sp. Leaf93]KQP08298.1 hypothetical protein ASF26_21515 [Methylobacterium sp. Leaf93]
MSKSPFADRPKVDAFVHTSCVEMMIHQARFLEEFTQPEALADAIAACSPANRVALARLGHALVRTATPTSNVLGTMV